MTDNVCQAMAGLQKSELAKVKARIKALTEKTVQNGCTEHEALQAAHMVGKLLDQYNLSMDEIDIREEKCVLVEIETGAKKRTPIDFCVVSIAKFCGIKVWFDARPSGAVYCFFGYEPDAQLASYLYDVIAKAMKVEHAAFKRTRTYTGRSSTSSFKKGMADRISNRLDELGRKREQELRRAEAAKPPTNGWADVPKTGTALVVLKGQLIEQAFKEQVGIRLRSASRSSSIRNMNAYRAGQSAGDRVNLSRPLDGGSNPSGYLS